MGSEDTSMLILGMEWTSEGRAKSGLVLVAAATPLVGEVVVVVVCSLGRLV